MQYSHLGRSGLQVSRLCLGSLAFGAKIDEREAHSLLDRALDRGVNFVDTSDVYGWKEGKEYSESIIGKWLGGGTDRRRERMVVATKVYEPCSSWPNDSRLSAKHIPQACEASLRRLRTDYIDLYQMHHIDRGTPWDEIWEAMEVLRSQGKILYVGSSNFAGWHIAQAQHIAAERSLLGLISEQSIYNLVIRDIEREVLPAARAYGVGLLVWSPLHRGMLAGALAAERAGVGRDSRISDAFLDRHRPQLVAYEQLCADIGAPPSRVALAWLLAQEGVASAIVGPVNAQQFDDTLGALDLTLDSETLKALDTIFPGYRTAPEDYAW